MSVTLNEFGRFVGTDHESTLAAIEGNRALVSLLDRLELANDTPVLGLVIEVAGRLAARIDDERERQDLLAGRSLESVCAFHDAFAEAMGSSDPLDAMREMLRSAGFIHEDRETAGVVYDVLADLMLADLTDSIA